ncbi:undecaprenyldiphospho-muramoylpentapeptide beta-N-acetylglucosaminyltransferase [Eubacterium coprostanoligenes]|uniref:undecaprenyldiphospho-muramoylpentapeptide beta-N-acetylglucosaminyltransferase n=1 Tax=Eubacterium coprostanoligenes TaxID=290054 RepID=UPI002353A3D5|nr:undecaprenyldiphospho-muramoylpentapeptide beta-N-acetylglucosaminyltransferase [Eubacterium coprostanoligenes]MCI6254827.1 undecaprenyldiphospho-muramoylpentapeptide beta-N-acetylglucosaminyltransferase [Eubacterium coprostanoligenes]MDY5400321.1 undecaprenyldiphospho-muramoylpentapeptide beta-N-acetylglucosaminyltransferase [Eubacterium coprostanoligenes]
MKLLFATGGTAGHINPALAVASYIKEQHPDYEIMFIGTADHMESRLVPNAGFEFKTIDINGFKRSFSPNAIIENVKTVGKLMKSEKESKNIIKEFQPDVVIGFGGYVSGPVLDEAAKLHIPTCIHEQNAYPGITNKQLAKKVDKVMLTVEDAANHMEAKCDVVITGLPVRGELLKKSKFSARIELGIADDKPLVLSFGGSLGAAPLNEAMFDIILEDAEKNDVYHIHSVGTNGKEYLEKFEANGFTKRAENVYYKGNAEVRLYIDNMDTCMAAADLVIGRAGASSLSEIEAMGKASILIPSPYVAENHQFHNAMALVNRNAARILREKDLTTDSLKALMNELISDKAELANIEKNAKEMAIIDSRERIADIILSLAK